MPIVTCPKPGCAAYVGRLDGPHGPTYLDADGSPHVCHARQAAAADLLQALKALLWQWDGHKQLMGLALADARAAVEAAEKGGS